MRKLALLILNSTTAVIRFRLDFKAKPNEKSHNCCQGDKFISESQRSISMKAPLSLRIATRHGDRVTIYLGALTGLFYVINLVGILTNDEPLLLLGTSSLLAVLLLILTSFFWLNSKITPEWIVIGRWRVPLRQVREIRVIRGVDGSPEADLLIVFEGGERLVKGVKNWSEVLETFRRFREVQGNM